MIRKDPESIEPQGFDWTSFLAELGEGEMVSSSSWSVTGSGLELSGSTIVSGNLKTVVTLTGGTPGRKYRVTNHIVTSSGVEDDRSFFVLIEDR